MHYYRSQLLKIVNPVVDAIAQNRKKNIEGQMDLFGICLLYTSGLSMP